ncbi:hypothetical protein ANN_20579 [Periplaneta americana]|uniref:Uncharacterized protein n=1 Tax=Periplaneta americana TaxID=6978 RepID=A0ABQ8SE57_PERAM|nr:hypothetical protein ANN_20579 [Periplaneta americana]
MPCPSQTSGFNVPNYVSVTVDNELSDSWFDSRSGEIFSLSEFQGPRCLFHNVYCPVMYPGRFYVVLILCQGGSHYLAPSDFHLITKLKDFLGGTRFGSDEELKKTVNTWLNELAAEEYNTGILKLVNRYDKCLNVGGDYVEK